jgi:DNA-binding XRE family transcriptional regulator
MNAKKLGKEIKIARVEADLTQEGLAKKISALQKNISRYETGSMTPSIETLVKIAKVLNKSTSHFLDI